MPFIEGMILIMNAYKSGGDYEYSGEDNSMLYNRSKFVLYSGNFDRYDVNVYTL